MTSIKLLLCLVAIIPLLLMFPLVNAMPITMGNEQNFILVGKPVLYVNGTYYHIKGTLKSVANYTLPGVLVTVDFKDKKTG